MSTESFTKQQLDKKSVQELQKIVAGLLKQESRTESKLANVIS